MSITSTSAPSHASTIARGPRVSGLEQDIAHAVHLLPTQGPISVFVHHNTFHALEHLRFESALEQGGKIWNCEPYWSEQKYREALRRGRFSSARIVEVLREDSPAGNETQVAGLCTRFELRRAMLEHDLLEAPPAELRWFVAETDALRKFRGDVSPERQHTILEDFRRRLADDPAAVSMPPRERSKGPTSTSLNDLSPVFPTHDQDAWNDATWCSFYLHLLWDCCGRQVSEAQITNEASPPPVRPRDLLLTLTGEDCDDLVHEPLIRFSAAYLDQGYADWGLPHRADGFWRAFLEIHASAAGPPERWRKDLTREFRRLKDSGVDELESICESLAAIGVPLEQRADFLAATLLALPGWAGMIHQLETNAEWAARPAPPRSLFGFLAARLILDRFAAAEVTDRNFGGVLSLQQLQSRWSDASQRVPHLDQQAFFVFQLAQILDWTPQQLQSLSPSGWGSLLNEIESFPSIERRKLLHRAYEREYRNHALDAVSTHVAHQQPSSPSPLSGSAEPAGGAPPSFQMVFCIDEREESFRRHLEEIDPRCETFAAAGFFGVAMYYRGASEAHPRPLCPVVITPRHHVQEEVAYTFVREHQRRAETRRVLGAASHQVHRGSRTFLGGALTAIIGTCVSVPMLARVLFPRTTAQIRRMFGRYLSHPTVTQLVLERVQPTPGPEPGHLGYSLNEMADIVERVLRDLGLTRGFAPLLIITGHGSSSLNNPHESAYNCGACSGGRGGPNARAFAQMANDFRVRQQLVTRGLDIPPTTTFVGAYHNTCDDDVTFFDLDRLPSFQRQAFTHVCTVLDETRQRNAHERCRRFESAPLNLTPEAALRHVEARSEDLSQARPEYNHATNAMCIVGRRALTRGLFLDRRSFLQSYDPTQDDADGSILTRILQAVIPVCAGISLEYYFSCVDPRQLGCGSKLPHNVTSLLGVMEGAAGDLRTGLSEQMTEIHEPMRILFIIETAPSVMEQIIQKNVDLGRLCRNEWVQLATVDGTHGEIHVYRNEQFELYRHSDHELSSVHSSLAWYRGHRDHLPFAEILPPEAGSVGGESAHSRKSGP